MSRFMKRLLIGFHRHPIRVAVETGVAFAAFWTLVDASQAFLQFSLGGWPRFLMLIALSVLTGAWRAAPSGSRTVRIPGSNSRLTVVYADLFSERGIVAVPVNEYFDCLLGAHVSARSVHGQAITTLFAGDAALFELRVDEALAHAPSQLVTRPSGRQRRYPIGTTAYLATGKPSVIAFVLTTTDTVSLKVSADVPQMWQALHGLWAGARIHCNDRPLSVPLIGGGLSGVGLSPQHLLSLLVISAATEMRRNRICADIRICLLESVRSATDIDSALQLVQ